ncbi:hypothetical protein EJB05_17543, partial [Eragrostis curvula]
MDLRFFVFTRLLVFAFFSLTHEFSLLRGACASKEALSPRQRCWRLGTTAVLCCSSTRRCTETLQFTSVAAAVTVMLDTGTSIERYLLVPFFALQAPYSAISWIKGEYGRWTALFGLLMSLLCVMPGELQLLVSTMLLIILGPDQFMNLRGSQGGGVLSVAIVVYLMFQHFAGVGGLRKAFGREAIITSLCIICMTVISLML